MKALEKQKSILIKNADYLVTMDNNSRILANSSVYIEGTKIKDIDTKISTADTVIDARGMIVLPGFINCHHHMFQCTLRGKTELQNQKIDRWIAIVCETTRQMSEETMYYSALANMAELLLYGCTTTTDMHYVFPKGKEYLFNASIKAAQSIGIRFHPYRGSMSLSKKDGASFPDDVVQDSDTIATESEQTIQKYHQDAEDSMIRIGLAPCTIFTNTKEDFKNAAVLSKKYNILLQTHLSESEYENEFSQDQFGKRPLAYLQESGWTGPRISFTHCTNLNSYEIKTLAQTQTHVVHCPISNARSPIGEGGLAPISEMLKNGVNVAIGVDGSAGNDSSNVLEELRWARILQGARKESTYLQPLDVLKMGTLNGAKLLNSEDTLGSLEEGKAADISLFSLSSIETAGAQDPLTAFLSTQARRAHTVLVNGNIVVDKGNLLTVKEERIVNVLRRH